MALPPMNYWSIALSQMVHKLVAIEGDHVFGPSEARKMRLPFNYGWENWAVIQDNVVILITSKFEIAHETYRALKNMGLTYETRH